MKKIISMFLAVVIAMTCLTVSFAADENTITLISDETEELYIIVPGKATDNEKYASDILKNKLEKIYNIEVKKATDIEKVAGKVICVGNTVYNKTDLTDKTSGSYTIKSVSNGISIYGNGNRGLIDGVYRFLSDYCGYEVYTKDVIRYTDEKSLVVPEDVNIEYSPYFEYRKVDTTSSYNEEYCLANSINSNLKVQNYQGGIIEYISEFCHTFSTEFCSRDTYFESHPEYFALHDGERTGNQLCLTNPETLKIVTQEVLQLLEQKWDKNADLQLISLTQDDNQDYCECENCKALDDANGSHAGTMISFVNAVADEVSKAGYNNVCIDTFAYRYTRTCPTNVVPRDNVCVRLCSIECCFGHTLDDPDCEENVEFMSDLRKWSSICDRLYIWDYVNNYSESFLPFADFQVLQRNVQIFYENGAKGVYEEGNYYMDRCNGEFYELRSYLLSKLMQNPYRDDYYELMDNYLINVYGPGGTYLREFIDLITKRSVTKYKHLSITQQPLYCLPGITYCEIIKADKMWENAKAMAQTAQQLDAVETSEICWQYWKSCRGVREYSPLRGLYKSMTNRKALYDKIISLGNSSVGEYKIKYIEESAFAIYFMPPTRWETKYSDKFWHSFDPYAEKFYTFLDGIFGTK